MVIAEAEGTASLPTFAGPVCRDPFIEALGRTIAGVTFITTARADGGSR